MNEYENRDKHAGHVDDPSQKVRDCIDNAQPVEDRQRFLNFANIEAVRRGLDAFKIPGSESFVDPLRDAYHDSFVNAGAALKYFGPAEFERLTQILGTFGINRNRWLGVVNAVYRREDERRRELARAVKAESKLAKKRDDVRPTWAKPAEIAADPVSGDALIVQLIDVIRRFVALEYPQALVVALWILCTWVFEYGAETNPFLRITSPQPICGKTTLMKLIAGLSRSALAVSSATVSAFVRTMMKERRTLILDEADAFLHENEKFRNVLDAASDPDFATVALSVKRDDWEPVNIDVFIPIAIASIGTLRRMQTVESRSIAIPLKRAKSSELKGLAKGRQRTLKIATKPFPARCARWAADNHSALTVPTMPESVSGREQDNWEPLIAIADRIGGEIARKAREAMLKMSQARGDAEESVGILLLTDLKLVFAEAGTVFSKDVCSALGAIEDRPWAEYSNGRRLTPNQLARILRPFEILPGSVRIGERTSRGYHRKQFEDAFDRYLQSHTATTDQTGCQNATTTGGVSESVDLRSVTGPPCDVSKNGTSPYGESECGDVADQKREYEDVEGKSSVTQAHTNEATNDPSANGIPSQMTNWMEASLRHLGHSDEEIARMKPFQAHEIIRAALQDRNYTDAEIREFTPAQKQAASFGADPNEEEIFKQ
jgi:putative DNA primase/helicase